MKAPSRHGPSLRAPTGGNPAGVRRLALVDCKSLHRRDLGSLALNAETVVIDQVEDAVDQSHALDLGRQLRQSRIVEDQVLGYRRDARGGEVGLLQGGSGRG